MPIAEISILSKLQKAIRVLLESGSANHTILKKERNKILHKIREIKFGEASTRQDRIAEGVEKAPDLVAMFKAAKALRTDMRQCIVIESGDRHIHVLAQDAHRAEKSRNTFVESSRLKQLIPFLSPSRISSVSQSPYLSSTVRSRVCRIREHVGRMTSLPN